MADAQHQTVYNVLIPVVANVAAPDRAAAVATLRRLVEEHGLTVYPDAIDAFVVGPEVRPCPLPKGCTVTTARRAPAA